MRDGSNDWRRGVLLLLWLLLLLLGRGHVRQTILQVGVAISLALPSLTLSGLFPLMSLARGLILARALS
jgi:hypothetical protein